MRESMDIPFLLSLYRQWDINPPIQHICLQIRDGLGIKIEKPTDEQHQENQAPSAHTEDGNLRVVSVDINNMQWVKQ